MNTGAAHLVFFALALTATFALTFGEPDGRTFALNTEKVGQGNFARMFTFGDQPYELVKRDPESSFAITPKKAGRFARHASGQQNELSFAFAKRAPFAKREMQFAFEEPSMEEERFARFARAAFAFAKRSPFAFA
uniref:Uncharacterized protein n=1 Tax=Parascaris univalens TaxID=6257 RepID=A0A915BKY8_PARUN